MTNSSIASTLYLDEATLREMVYTLDPLLEIEGHYDEQGFETSPGLHQKKLKEAQALATRLFRIAAQAITKSQSED